MLEVGAETLDLEGGPEDELLDGVALAGPAGELVGKGGELGLEALDGGLVVEEEDSARGAAEAGDAVGCLLPAGLGNDGLEDGAGDVPELGVLGAEEDEQAVGLGVERGWGVEGGLLDELLDAGGSDGAQVLVEGVDGTTGLDQLEEGLVGELGSHDCG